MRLGLVPILPPELCKPGSCCGSRCHPVALGGPPVRPNGTGRAVGPWAAQAGEAGKEAEPQRSSLEA